MKTTQENITGFFLYKAKTKNGIEFDPNDNIWSHNDLSKTYKFDFDSLHIVRSRIYGLKRTFVWYLETHSLSHTGNMFRSLKWLLDYIFEQSEKDIDMIKSTHLINYKSTLDPQHEWYLGSLSGFLKKWYEMGFPGLLKDAYDYLNETTFKSNEKGRAVLTMDPFDGPFTDLELESIQVAINNSYAEKEITHEDYLLVWLFMIYGSRPLQFAQLKICDLLSPKRKDGSQEYIIRIPRAKNRKKPRSEFKERIVPSSIGKLLFEYRELIKVKFVDLRDDPEQAPLFASTKKEQSGEFAYHQNAEAITDKIQSIIGRLNLISVRTGEDLHITATRFRRTIGTRAAAEGHGELIIAEILDHTDTQNAGVYVQATPEIINRIDKAMAIQLAPIAQAFAGLLVPDKSKAKRADDPASDIIDPGIDSGCKPMGKCGSYGFCGLFAPLACYTCSSFQAWDDGPHEQVLHKLLEDRERLRETADYRIASVNDKTILAVAQVIIECEEIKSQNILDSSS